MISGFHAVVPKKDCPHCTEDNIAPKESFADCNVFSKCNECPNEKENWLCLKPGCKTVACSRYVHSHMVKHQGEHPDHSHPIVFSFADFSYWCYACDSYVEHVLLQQAKFFHSQKFAEGLSEKDILKKIKESEYKEELNEEDEEEDSDEEKELPTPGPPQFKEESKEELKEDTKVDSLLKQMKSLSLDDDVFTYDNLVQGLKEGAFKNIVVMTGAGISVSAGIPDFRSPGTGVYANLAKYKLPTPEALFQIDFFINNPEPFYDFAQNFDLTKFNPTPTHFFIKMLQDKGILLANPTQNIDNLEEKAGMDMTKVL